MSSEIIVALIALAGVLLTAAGSIITQIMLAKRAREDMLAEIAHQSELSDAKLEAKLERYIGITDTKLDELTREVREHNNFARRMPVVEEQIKVANHRIADLEKVKG